ncbi:hypothetical protein AAEO56_06565 [Flavobacterium sp. DGU11]|uniref:Uncharacterized protein n=1 Tax=Flavobacterium arundinis TaxID=3139143 RepID=A0ABU9HUU1_9FLAO
MTPPTIDQIEHYCNDLVSSWKENYAKKNYKECLELSQKFITNLKPIYNDRLYGDTDQAKESYSCMYIFMILSKSFEDVIKLVELTANKNWPNDQAKTESIWQVLWDAKERLDIFNSHCRNKNLFKFLLQQLKKLEHCFYDLFGKGIYMSPVILVKKASCSICGLNIKGCAHIPGYLYDGKPCKEIAEDFEIQGADIVQSPHDMRCRVWPWNFIDESRVNVRIMNLNKLDDFIKN